MAVNEKQISEIISKAESLVKGNPTKAASLLSDTSAIEKIATEVLGKFDKDDLGKIMKEIQKSAIFKTIAGEDGKLDAGDIKNGIDVLKKLIK